MSNVFRGMVFVIGLAVVIGSILVTSAEDAIITISSPYENEIVYNENITVYGDVTGYRGALIKSVTVNDKPAEGTGPNGGFSSWEKNISFQEKGENTITVNVTDVYNHNTTKKRVVYYRTPPSAPQNLKSTAEDDYVTLKWIAPDDDGGSEIRKYNIYRGTAPGRLSPLTTVDNVLSYDDHNVTNDQRYCYQVSAVNSKGEGEKSMETCASTPKPIPTSTASPTQKPVQTSTPKPPSTQIPTTTPTSPALCRSPAIKPSPAIRP